MEPVHRARPADELVDQQRQGKTALRREIAQRSFREKVALLLQMQRALYPVLRQRREMRWWERTWEIDP